MNQQHADPFQDLVNREEREAVKLYAARLTALRAKPDEFALEEEMAAVLSRRGTLGLLKHGAVNGKDTTPLKHGGTIYLRENEDDRQKNAIRISKQERIVDAYLKTLDAEYGKLTHGSSFIAGYDPALHTQLQKPVIVESSTEPASAKPAAPMQHILTPTRTSIPILTDEVAALSETQAPATIPVLTDVVDLPAKTVKANGSVGGLPPLYWNHRDKIETKRLQDVMTRNGGDVDRLHDALVAHEKTIRTEQAIAKKRGAASGLKHPHR
jgi:hypothetical protein